MKTIKLTQGKFALVDDEDFEELNKYKWYADFHRNTYYSRRNSRINGKRVGIKMHREIMSPSKNMQVDHIDGNGLNNQKENLRICTNSQNCMNRKKHRNNTSKYKGVSWHKQHRKWIANICMNNKQIFLGLFNNKIEAHKAYCNASKKYHGEFAHI